VVRIIERGTVYYSATALFAARDSLSGFPMMRASSWFVTCCLPGQGSFLSLVCTLQTVHNHGRSCTLGDIEGVRTDVRGTGAACTEPVEVSADVSLFQCKLRQFGVALRPARVCCGHVNWNATMI
jgi:hypothetical protein